MAITNVGAIIAAWQAGLNENPESAAAQVGTDKAQSKYLDLHAALYGTPRLPGENDDLLLSRLKLRVTDASSMGAMAAALTGVLGVPTTVATLPADGSPARYQLGSGHRIGDGRRLGAVDYSVAIPPATISISVTNIPHGGWERALAVIEMIRPAGVFIRSGVTVQSDHVGAYARLLGDQVIGGSPAVLANAYGIRPRRLGQGYTIGDGSKLGAHEADLTYGPGTGPNESYTYLFFSPLLF